MTEVNVERVKQVICNVSWLLDGLKLDDHEKQDLNMQKIFAKMVPWLLNDHQIEPYLLCRILTVDGTRNFMFDPEIKLQSC